MIQHSEKWITAIATIFVPVILTFAGTVVTNKIAKRDLSLRYIEVATDILKTESNPIIRDWAVDVINHYSEIKMSGAVKQAISGRGAAIEQGPDEASGKGYVR